ncbi:MAG TPA: cobalt ECF transporter T component CbiQ [Anaerolineales bacterium]|nr:cobalt ECF transporter T component CbiQ [Anaerolineales bacterium]
MHFDAFDSYLPGSSPVHRRDPRVKIVCCLLFILSAVLLPDGAWTGFGLAWLIVLAIALWGGIAPSVLLRRSLVAAPFALTALTLPFTLPGDPVAHWSLGRFALTISDAGILRFSGIVIRSWLAVQAAVILTTTTQFPDIVHGLRHLRVPDLITGILAFMYRYLFVLADEALRLLRARDARSAAAPGRTAGLPLRRRAGVAGGMVGQLFLRSLDRSDRVHRAMQARGYAGELLTMNPHVMARADWFALAAAGAVVLLPHILG